MSSERYRGHVSVTPTGRQQQEAIIEIEKLGNGRTRFRIGDYGEGEAQADAHGQFSDAPFASGSRQHRVRGVIEQGDDGIQGGFTVERDGRELAKGRFRATRIN
ncbi:hypothetical protein HZA87_04825 [Candidatus Uhrbacteria bacterium]|nr:hypothetical protein [Candidatus Uhrbacteria bacterium]